VLASDLLDDISEDSSGLVEIVNCRASAIIINDVGGLEGQEARP